MNGSVQATQITVKVILPRERPSNPERAGEAVSIAVFDDANATTDGCETVRRDRRGIVMVRQTPSKVVCDEEALISPALRFEVAIVVEPWR